MGSADLMRATINAITPGDIKDPPEGISPVQPSYLNIEVALLSAPEWPLQVLQISATQGRKTVHIHIKDRTLALYDAQILNAFVYSTTLSWWNTG